MDFVRYSDRHSGKALDAQSAHFCSPATSDVGHVESKHFRRSSLEPTTWAISGVKAHRLKGVRRAAVRGGNSEPFSVKPSDGDLLDVEDLGKLLHDPSRKRVLRSRSGNCARDFIKQ